MKSFLPPSLSEIGSLAALRGAAGISSGQALRFPQPLPRWLVKRNAPPVISFPSCFFRPSFPKSDFRRPGNKKSTALSLVALRRGDFVGSVPSDFPSRCRGGLSKGTAPPVISFPSCFFRPAFPKAGFRRPGNKKAPHFLWLHCAAGISSGQALRLPPPLPRWLAKRNGPSGHFIPVALFSATPFRKRVFVGRATKKHRNSRCGAVPFAVRGGFEPPVR